MNLPELRDRVDRYVRDYSAIQRLISSDKFTKWYEKLNESQQSLVLFCVSGHRYHTLRRMLNHDLPLECMSYRRLRHECSIRGIPRFTRLSKDEMIYTIIDHEERMERHGE